MTNLKNNHKQILIAMAIFLSTMFLACEGEDVDSNYHGSFGDGLGIADRIEQLQK